VTPDWTKSDLINWIAKDRGYRSYLEICSLTTGLGYGGIDHARFARSHRLMYRCPQNHTDGMPIDFRSVGLDISAPIQTIRARGSRYDIILVDSYHEYGASMRDLTDALSLLTDHGTIVVHDCLPPRAEIAGPQFVPGEWCGVSYKAYLDFVFARPDLEYRTVDIDYGCGIIRKSFGWPRLREWWRASREREALIEQWSALGNDYNKTFALHRKNRQLLCNLRSLDDFIAEQERLGSNRAD
jgi:hypothetical protein